MFSVEERSGVREHFLRMADADARVLAAAVVGSFARGIDDRWSGLDLAIPLDAQLRELAG